MPAHAAQRPARESVVAAVSGSAAVEHEAPVRIKSRWFRGEETKSARDVAGAAAFIAWRIAHNALKTMRAAGFDIVPGVQYFGFVEEFLAFLVVGADRLAHARGDAAWRVEFTTAMARRAGEILADNEAELLGTGSHEAIRRRFVATVNARAADCADYGWTAAGPDYGLLRYLGHRIAEVMRADEGSHAIAQVIECEAPEAADTLRRGIAGLLGETGSRRARGERVVSGD